VNPTGAGPWSVAAEDGGVLVPSNCPSGSYLTTHTNVTQWGCALCPVGAFCGGASASNVTARAGYWRVPWSPSALGFAKCPIATSCLGYREEDMLLTQLTQGNTSVVGSSGAVAAALTPGRSLSHTLASLGAPSAVPVGLLGNPERDERCDVGYQGVLCTDCQPGYARWGAYGCRKCVDSTSVILGVTAVTLLLLLVIAGLVLGVLKGDKQAKQRVLVPACKIAFSHLQTVAIAASYSLWWPDSVLGLFAGMQSMTSVSSDVLSLDCLLGEHSSFFWKSGVLLLVPPALFVLIAVFWLALFPPVRCICERSPCAKRRGRRRSSEVHPVSSGRLEALSPRSAMASPSSVSIDNEMADTTNPIARVREAVAPACDESRSSSPRSSLRHPSASEGSDSGMILSNGSAVAPDTLVAEGPSQVRKCGHCEAIVDFLTIGETAVGSKLSALKRTFVTCIVAAFFVHMSMTDASLKLLTCTRIVHDSSIPIAAGMALAAQPNSCPSQWRLAADLEVCCDNPAVTERFWMGIPGLLLYAVGIPAMAAGLLWAKRDQLAADDQTIATLGFLYNGFRSKAFFWETVVMLRKVLVSAVAVLLAPWGPKYQTYAGVAVIFSFTVAHAAMKPFEKDLLNWLEFGSLATAFITLECGLFLTEDSTDVAGVTSVVATTVLFVCNIGFLLSALFVMAQAWRGRYRSAEVAEPAPAPEGTVPALLVMGYAPKDSPEPDAEAAL
jgi:hypothetical protein